jgi:hypothetical protein
MIGDSIFVQIAAYRDPELLPTLRDAIEKAKHPDNLVFSICWQHNPEDKWDNLDPYKNDSRFKIIDVFYKDSKGCCWARNLLQQQYAGEKYTLQLDSHHRFVQDWDEMCINMVDSLKAKGYKKPLLTAYLNNYDPTNDPGARPTGVLQLDFNRFSPEGILHTHPNTLEGSENMALPALARFFSAHFCFTTGEFAKDVQHDPQLYFHGEEISLAVRAWTHGYDLFHPNRIIAFHEYGRNKKPRHWADNPHSDEIPYRRVRELFGVWMDSPKDMTPYGLGTERTLDAYERFAGVRFKDLTVQKYTLSLQLAPNPTYPFKKDYDASFLHFYKHCIDVGYHEMPEKDYEFWVASFHFDSNIEGQDTTIYRRDVPKDEIQRMFEDPDKYCKVWCEFFYDKEPNYCMVRPYSKSKGWIDPLVKRLDYAKAQIEEVAKESETGNSAVGEVVASVSKIEDYEFEQQTADDEILVYIPKYDNISLVATIESAIFNSLNPERLHFFILSQLPKESDGLDKWRDDIRFRIEQAWDSEEHIGNGEEYVLHVGSASKFEKNWDYILVAMHKEKEKNAPPILNGISFRFQKKEVFDHLRINKSYGHTNHGLDKAVILSGDPPKLSIVSSVEPAVLIIKGKVVNG